MAVAVDVAVASGVLVAVDVAVAVAVGVNVGVCVAVAVGDGVLVAVSVGIREGTIAPRKAGVGVIDELVSQATSNKSNTKPNPIIDARKMSNSLKTSSTRS